MTATPTPDAAAAAARLLAGARQPAIAGLGCDVDGIRAALKLAARLGAIVDHAAVAHTRVELRVLADSGVMNTTAVEARHRGDLVVLAGPGAVAHADQAKAFADGGGLYAWRGPRSVLCLGTGNVRPRHMTFDGEVFAFGDGASVDRSLALLSARLAGRPVAPTSEGPDLQAVDTTVARLKAAKFGVVIYDPADFDHVALDALQSLVKALNNETRFSSLAVPAHHHGRGASLVSSWMTGDRLPLGLGRGFPEQDDWRYDVERAVTAGEADALLWIGALGPDLPDWAKGVPTVALVHHGAKNAAADVVIEVGVPGVTHAGVLADAVRDAFAHVEARAPQALPSVAAVLAGIDAALPGAAS